MNELEKKIDTDLHNKHKWNEQLENEQRRH